MINGCFIQEKLLTAFRSEHLPTKARDTRKLIEYLCGFGTEGQAFHLDDAHK